MIKVGFSGEYTVSKYKKGQKPKEIAKFHNLITDWGLKYQGLNNIPLNICIGSSATAPSVGDSDLKGFLYQETSLTTEFGYHQDLSEPEWYVYGLYTATFAPKNKNYTVREIGFGRVANNGIYSRSITKDLDGNPTDIVVLEDEYLRVTYELRMYFATEPTTLTFTPSGDDVTPREAQILAYNVPAYLTKPHNKILYQQANSWYQNVTSLGDASNNPNSWSSAGTSITNNITQDSTGFGGTIKLSATVSQGISSNVNGFRFGNIGAGGNYSPYWKVFLPVGFKKTNEDVAEFSLHISWGRK